MYEKALQKTFCIINIKMNLDFRIFILILWEYLQPIVTQYLVCNKSEIWP